MFGLDDAIAIPAISSAFSSLMSFEGGESRNDSQIQQAQKQMDFQERMSGTSYQRAVTDLQAAGLNPMLAYQHGGASTPAGAMANIEDTITPAVNSGNQAYRAVNEAAVQREQVKDIAASAGLKVQQTSQSAAETDKADKEARVAEQQAVLTSELAKKAVQETVTSAKQASFFDAHSAFLTEQIKKVAPEIKLMVTQMGLNDANRQRALAEIPMIAATIPKIRAETEESYQRRLLIGIETRLKSLQQNKAEHDSWMMQPSGIGSVADAVKQGVSAVPGLSWLFK